MDWTAVWHKMSEAAKAIVAFVLPIILQVIYDLANNTEPWPSTGREWIRFVLPSIALALGVYGVPNRPTVAQVERAVDKLGVAQVQAVVDRAGADPL